MTNKKTVIFSFLIFVFSCLSACSRLPVEGSGETVYLYAAGIPDRERKEVVTLLEAEGYKVILPDQESPFAGKGHTIVYFPFAGVDAHLSRIVSVLNSNGYEVSKQYSKETGNHWYTEGNIGIYLDGGPVETGAKEKAYQTIKLAADLMATEFDSQQCQGRHVYEFGKEDKLYYTDLSGERDVLQTFEWYESSNDIVVIKANGKSYRYKRYESTKGRGPNNESGRMESKYVFMLNLKPVKNYPPPFGCHFMGEVTGFSAH